MPLREPLSRCGALVIDSMPPATTTFAEPAQIRSWPNITAFMPEPHTLLMVVQPAASGMLAARDGLGEGGGKHGTHEGLASLVGGQAGMLEPAAARGCAQGRGRNAAALAEEGIDRSETGGGDDDVAHGMLLHQKAGV